MSRVLPAFAVILFSFVARAAEHGLKLESVSGKDSRSTSLEYTGNEEPDESAGRWGWNAGLARSSLRDAGEITDTTSSLNLGVDYRARWRAALGLSSSSTPEENLRSSGIEGSAGYKFDLWENDEFRANLTPKLVLGTTDYALGTQSTGRRVSRAKEEEIRQNRVGFRLSFAPVAWFAVSLGRTNYAYSKDINSFVSQLDSRANPSLGLASFAANAPLSVVLR